MASDVGVRPDVFNMFERIEYSRLAVSDPKLYEDRLKENRLGSDAKSRKVSDKLIDGNIPLKYDCGSYFSCVLLFCTKDGLMVEPPTGGGGIVGPTCSPGF